IHVDQHGVRADYSIDRHVRAGNDERHRHRALEHRALPPETMLAEHLAMIRRVDHAGRATEPAFLEGSQHDPDLFVEEADKAVVRGDGPPDRRLVERRRETELTTVQLVHRMARPPCVGPRDRQRQLVLVIEAEVRVRDDERKVRRHEADEEHPWLSATGGRGFLTEPPPCRLGDRSIVAHVLAFACARLDDVPETLRAWRHVTAQKPIEVASPVHDVERHPLVRESARVVHAPIVQLSDRCHVVALRGQSMPPARRLGANVGCRVVPRVDRVGPAAGREASTRGHADGRLAVCAREARTPCYQCVEVRRSHDPVAVAAEDAACVLVGQDDENVGRLERSQRPPPWDAAIASASASTRRASSTCRFSMRRPSSTATPRPRARASVWAAITRRAQSTSPASGAKTSLARATCFGWISVLPSKPNSAACRQAATKPAPAPESRWTPSRAVIPAERAASTQSWRLVTSETRSRVWRA